MVSASSDDRIGASDTTEATAEQTVTATTELVISNAFAE